MDGGREDKPTFMKKLDRAVDFLFLLIFGFGWILFVLIFPITQIVAPFLSENLRVILEVELYEVVFQTTPVSLVWLEILHFPILLLVTIFILQRRKAIRWERRYPPEHFVHSQTSKTQMFITIYTTMLTLFYYLVFSAESSNNIVSLDVPYIFAIFLLGFSAFDIISFVRRSPNQENFYIAHIVAPILALFWQLSMYIISEYYHFSEAFFVLLFFTLFVAFATYASIIDESHSDYTIFGDKKLIKELRKGEVGNGKDNQKSVFLLLHRLTNNPPSPDFFPTGVKFRTFTNKKYPWEGQSEPDTILGLLTSHLNKLILVTSLIVVLCILYPPLLVFMVIIFFLEPPHIHRKMSPDFRVQYDALIHRCEDFFEIKYGEDEEYAIHSMTPKFEDTPEFRFGGDGISSFGRPERLLGSKFFDEYERVERRIVELEMIRDHGRISETDSSLMILVNGYGLQDQLSRYIKKMELKYFPQHIEKASVEPEKLGSESLEQRLNSEISELKERLEQHETILNRITIEGDWRYIYSEKRTKNALNDIRTCTERLLYSRVESLGHTLPERGRTLRPLMDFLSQQKISDLQNIAIKHVKVIEAVVNPASHEMQSSDDDYLKALDSFVQLVEWHVENPPLKA